MTDEAKKFYGMLEHNINIRQNMEKKLFNHYKTEADNSIYVPEVGMICGVLMESFDGIGPMWYRCQILRLVKPGQCEILLVDEGRKVEVDSNILRYLENDFFQMEKMAICFELVDPEPAERSVIEAWMDRSRSSVLYMKVHYVRKDISTTFIEKIPSIGFVTWRAPKPIFLNRFEGMIVHMEMLNNELNFVVHTMKQVGELEEMNDHMTRSQHQIDPSAVTDWKVDEICIARFDDNRYYRGKIVEVNQNQNECLVCFVDFGKKASVHFGDISRYIMYHGRSIMMLRYKLSGIRMIDGRWTPEAEKELADFCLGCICQINVVNTDIYPFVCSIYKKDSQESLAKYLVDHQIAKF